MKQPLVIIGAGEFAEIAYEYFTFDSEYDVVAFAVDPEFLHKGSELHGIPVVNFLNLPQSHPPESHDVFVAIPASNLNQTRADLFTRAKNMGYTCATYLSSKAFVWRNASIGENCFIFEGNVVQPFVTIGDNCILWSGNHIGHRTQIHNHVFVSSHVVISGYCNIGSYSFLGVNSTLNDHVSIAEHCIVGAAAHMNKDGKSGLVYSGSPARAIPGLESFSVEL